MPGRVTASATSGREMIALPVDRAAMSRYLIPCVIEKGKFRLPGKYGRYVHVSVRICYPKPPGTKYWIDLENQTAEHLWGDATRVEVGMLLEIWGVAGLSEIRRYYQVVAKTDATLALKRTRKGEVPRCVKCGQRHLGVIPQILELKNGERVYLRGRIRKRKVGVDRWFYRKRRGKINYTKAPGTDYVNKVHHGYYGIMILKAWEKSGGQELEMPILSKGPVSLLPCALSTKLRSRLREKGFTEDEINRKSAEAGNLLEEDEVKQRYD